MGLFSKKKKPESEPAPAVDVVVFTPGTVHATGTAYLSETLAPLAGTARLRIVEPTQAEPPAAWGVIEHEPGSGALVDGKGRLCGILSPHSMARAGIGVGSEVDAVVRDSGDRWVVEVPVSDEAQAAYDAALEARTVWFNVSPDNWLANAGDSYSFATPSLAEAEIEGKAGLALFDGDDAVCAVTKRMKAHGQLAPFLGRGVWRAGAWKKTGDYGDYWRVKVVFDG